MINVRITEWKAQELIELVQRHGVDIPVQLFQGRIRPMVIELTAASRIPTKNEDRKENEKNPRTRMENLGNSLTNHAGRQDLFGQDTRAKPHFGQDLSSGFKHMELGACF